MLSIILILYVIYTTMLFWVAHVILLQGFEVDEEGEVANFAKIMMATSDFDIFMMLMRETAETWRAKNRDGGGSKYSDDNGGGSSSKVSSEFSGGSKMWESGGGGGGDDI